MSRYQDPDGEGDFDLYHDDGWTPTEIANREHMLDGEYLGPKPPYPDAA